MEIFLSSYGQIKASIDNFFALLCCHILSCDHTLKGSKDIGVIQVLDSAFVNQFQNLYIGLDQTGKVLMWCLTKSTDCKEINDLVLDFKKTRKQSLFQEKL